MWWSNINNNATPCRFRVRWPTCCRPQRWVLRRLPTQSLPLPVWSQAFLPSTRTLWRAVRLLTPKPFASCGRITSAACLIDKAGPNTWLAHWALCQGWDCKTLQYATTGFSPYTCKYWEQTDTTVYLVPLQKNPECAWESWRNFYWALYFP